MDTAFRLIEAEGFDALTMRQVAAALETGPASLYAHVRSKAELDDLLIGELFSQVRLPAPDPARWRAQVVDVARQLRDQYLRYPGISRAAFAAAPANLESVRISEGLLAILLGARVPPQAAAWAIDALYLYVSAYSFEMSLRAHLKEDPDGHVRERADVVERLQLLPVDRFPHIVAYAQEVTAGVEHDRFDFALELLLGGLAPNAKPTEHEGRPSDQPPTGSAR